MFAQGMLVVPCCLRKGVTKSDRLDTQAACHIDRLEHLEQQTPQPSGTDMLFQDSDSLRA